MKNKPGNRLQELKLHSEQNTKHVNSIQADVNNKIPDNVYGQATTNG